MFFFCFFNNVPKCHLKWNNNFVARGTVQLSVILYFVVFFFFQIYDGIFSNVSLLKLS